MAKLNAEKKYARNRKIDARKINIGIVGCNGVVIGLLEMIEKCEKAGEVEKEFLIETALGRKEKSQLTANLSHQVTIAIVGADRNYCQ